MPTFNIPVETSKYDPFAFEKSIEKLTGSSQKDRNTSILNPDDSLQTLSGIDVEYGQSLLGNDQLADQSILETKAFNQGPIELAAKFLGNTASTVLFELLKVPGYIGGGVMAAGNEMINPEKDNINLMVDNAWVNAFSKLDEETKALFPTYVSQNIQEGDLMSKLSSGQWWATTGADGVGFLLSMILPGQAAKLLGIGAKLGSAGEALANSSKWAGKILSKAGVVEEVGSGVFSFGNKFARAADGAASASINAFIEAAAEGANTFDNVKQKAIADGLTEEQAVAKASDAAAGVFKTNIPLLLMSNMLDESWLFKSFGNSKNVDNVMSQLFKNGELSTDALKRLNWKDYLKKGTLNVAKSFAKEGLIEEGSQTLLQKNIEESGDKGVLENMYNVITNYYDELLTNPEMQESVVLGGILGGGMSVLGTRRDIKDYNDLVFGNDGSKPSVIGRLLGDRQNLSSKGLSNILSENLINNFKSVQDIALKDDKGNIIYEDGKIKLDEKKLLDVVEGNLNLIDANLQYDLAVAKGDAVTSKVIANKLSFNYLRPFIEQEGGDKVFEQHVKEQLVEKWATRYKENTGLEATDEQKEEFKNQYTENFKKLKTSYDKVANTHHVESKVKPNSANQQYYEAWKNRVFADKLNNLLTYESLTEFKQSQEQVEYNRIKEKPEDERTLNEQILVKVVEAQNKQIDSVLEKSKQDYLDLFEKKTLEQHFQDYIKEQEKIIEDTVKDQDEIQKTQEEQLSDISTEINNQEFDPVSENKQTIVEDKNGNRYLVSKLNVKGKVKNIIYSKDSVKELTPSLIKSMGIKVLKDDDVALEQFKKELEISNEQFAFSVESAIAEYNSSIEQFNLEKEQIQKDIVELQKKLKVYTSNNKTTKSMSKSELRQIEKDLKKDLAVKEQLLAKANIDIKFVTSVIEFYNMLENNTQNIISNSRYNTLQTIKEFEEITQNREKLSKAQNAQEAKELYDEISKFIFELEKQYELNKENWNEINNYLNFNNWSSTLVSISRADNFEDLLVPFNDQEIAYLRKLRKDYLDIDIGRIVQNKILKERTVNYLKNKPDLVSKLKALNKDNIQIAAKDRTYLDNVDAITDELYAKIENAYKGLVQTEYLFNYLDLQKRIFNLQNNVQTDSSSNVTVDDEHTEIEIAADPHGDQTKMADVFADKNLGIHRFVTAGLNVFYETEGPNKGQDSLTAEGLPQLNRSQSQQDWYKFIDSNVQNLTNFALQIYNPKYDDSSDLEKAIGANNPSKNRKSDDLVAVLVDKNGNVQQVDGKPLFTTLWRADVLYADKPRIAEDTILFSFLDKIKVNKFSLNNFDFNKLEPNDQKRLLQALGKQSTDVVTKQELFTFALEDSRSEYKTWIAQVVKLNSQNKKVFVNIEGVTSGKALKKRDPKTRVLQWNNILKNIKQIKLQKGTGKQQLQGAEFKVANISGFVQVGTKEIKVKPGDVVLVLNNESNFIPTLSRNLNDEEVKLSMYLMSIADEKANLSVSLPENMSYSVNGKTIVENVKVFFYKKEDGLGNFSLLNTIFNYGRKHQNKVNDTWSQDGLKGQIFVATKTKQIVFTDFDGVTKYVKLSDLKKAIATGNFENYNQPVKYLYEFLKNKRANVNKELLEQNGMFPKPVLKTNVDTSGKRVYTVEFDNSKTYYEHLLNDVLSTSAYQDSRYPNFLQRNVFFNSKFYTQDQSSVSVQQSQPKAEVAIPVQQTPVNKTTSTNDKLFDELSAKYANEQWALKLLNKSKQKLDSTDPNIINQVIDESIQDLVDLSERYLNEVPDSNPDEKIVSKNSGTSDKFTQISDLIKYLRSRKIANTLQEVKLENQFSLDNLNIPDELSDYNEANKFFSPEQMLSEKLKNGEIKQECK